MAGIESKNSRTNSVFLFFSAILLVFLAYAVVWDGSAVLDVLAAIASLAVVAVFDRRFGLSFWPALLLSISILLNPLGSFFLYSRFVFSEFVGYDKVIHFFISFAITYGIVDLCREKKNFLTFASALLITMGLGAFTEIAEFIGEVYLGLDAGGFIMSDSLPHIKSDLQRYDTHFDLIFNLLGSLACIISVVAKDSVKKRVKR
ncbi:MAG TPA: DUF2238 domain-containing protein [Candidatus Altiarchaeales archaeon]|nr:DUF2238 domain-containing protein [Candidatus Altiarchaeales archaeon]